MVRQTKTNTKKGRYTFSHSSINCCWLLCQLWSSKPVFYSANTTRACFWYS